MSEDRYGTHGESDGDYGHVVMDMSHACDVIRVYEGCSPSLPARMGTGGNQVPMTYARQAIGEYKESDCGSTCSAHYQKGETDLIASKNIVRRLTPLECERLQGFPDGWTDIGAWTDTKGKTHKESTDSARYKALGNSIAIPPWTYVLQKLSAYCDSDHTMASLFDGIGGFPLIWERLNDKGACIWASEIEEFPIAVTKAHFPEYDAIPEGR